jgi:competence ComEA-like helix-hairpin-helix protein
VKQDFPPAKAAKQFVIWLLTGLLFFCSACATRNRQVSSLAQTSADLPATGSRININTAPAEGLEALPGVGRVIAERIIEHRTKYGPFRRVEHLMMVRGISERKFRTLQPMISLE